MQKERQNRVYLPEVEFPRELRIDHAGAGVGRADFVFLGVPSAGLDEVIASLAERGLSRAGGGGVVGQGAGAVRMGTPPTELLRRRFRRAADRVHRRSRARARDGQ